MPDAEVLDRQLKKMVRGWGPAVEGALAEMLDAGRAAALAQRYAAGFPPGYRNGAGPVEAAVDIGCLHQLTKENRRAVRMYRNPEDNGARLRLKLYSQEPVALSDAVPVLENFGFHAIDEMSTAVDGGKLGHIQRFVLELPTDSAADVVARADRKSTRLNSSHVSESRMPSSA